MRVKRGFASRRRHKRLLKLASGFQGRRKNCFKLAKRAVQRAMVYSYRDRKVRKREFRTLWIARINAGVRTEGLSYSKFMRGLKLSKLEINRKMLGELAVSDFEGFKTIVTKAKQALASVSA